MKNVTGNEKAHDTNSAAGEDAGPGWFATNIGWIAATCTAITAIIGLALRYEELKTFCYEHFECLRNRRKKEDLSEVTSTLVNETLI